MPLDVTQISFDTRVGTARIDQWDNVVVIARAPTANPPTPGFNTAQNYRDASRVADDFGIDSDAHTASQLLESRGMQNWKVLALEQTETTEVLGDSATTATDRGTVTTTPMAGEYDTTVTVDGTAHTVIYTTDSPPDANQTPGATEALVNTDTGEVVTGTTTSGTGTGIEVTYANLSWATGLAGLDAGLEDVAFMADVRAGRDSLGDIDELVTWGMNGHVVVPVAYRNGSEYADDAAAMDAYHEITRYAQAGALFPLAHKSPDDVAASMAGWFGTRAPWDDPFYMGDGFPNISMPDNFDTGLIGDLNTPGTLEGGDSVNGLGGVNPLFAGTETLGTLTLVQSQTAAGQGSNYPFVDLFRTEGLVRREIENGLRGLLMDDAPSFTETGRLQVRNRLDESLARYESDDRAFSNLQIHVPRPENLPETDRGNRRWSNIGVQYRYNGTVHSFQVDVNATV